MALKIRKIFEKISREQGAGSGEQGE